MNMTIQEPTVLYEDAEIMALHKPAGLLMHRASYMKEESRGNNSTLVDWLLAHRPQIRGVGDEPVYRPGIVHRLDRETSGVILVAKTQNAFDALKSLFQHHEVQKTYLALVFGRLGT